MIIKVTKDKVSIEQNELNHYGEYNVNECNFEFDEHFDSVLVKRAIFTSKSTNKTIEIDIINNKCVVPSDILVETYDQITLGVYGYDTEEEELLIRYSPEPTTFVVHEGSYREGAEQPEIITPTQYDMYSKALQEGLAEVDKRLDDVEKQGDYASEQGDYAKEQGDYAKSEGDNAKSVAEETEKKAQEGAFDGKSLEFVWQGTKLGVRLEGQEEYHFVDLQGKQGEIGATGEPFKIKKTYASVSEMNADFANMQFGDYVMIASSVEVEDNAKLYTKGESAWIFISDFSGAMGIRGETGLTPNIKIGEVKTLEAGSQAKVTRSGSNEEPVFNFELPKGDKGDNYVLTEEDKVEIGEKVNTEYEKRIEQNEKYILDLEATVDILTNTDKKRGELVHITDALSLATFETTTDGNVEQETTKGKQLFNCADIVITDGVTVDEEGWITATYDNTNGTTGHYLNYSAIKNELLNVSQDYAVVLEIKSFTGKGNLAVDRWGQFKAPWSILSSNMSPNTIYVKIMTTKDDFSIVNICDSSNIYVLAGNSFSITYRISILEDTTVTADTFIYEKYTGGQASPNLNYQQPIKVITGSVDIKVNGKNWFDGRMELGVWNVNSGTKVVNNTRIRNVEKIKIKPNTLYTMSTSSSAGEGYQLFYDKNGNYLNINNYIVPNHKFTTPANAYYMCFYFIDETDTTVKIQIELGSTATDYEPFQEQITYIDLKGNEVVKGDNIIIDKKGNVSLVKNWVKEDLNDTNVNKKITEYNGLYWVGIKKPTNSKMLNNFKSYKMFVNCAYYSDIREAVYSYQTRISGLGWGIIVNSTDTIEDIRPKILGGYYYYELAEPQIIELGTLEEPIKTFEGVNNIQLLANLDTEIEVMYALDVKKYYDNKLAEISAQII